MQKIGILTFWNVPNYGAYMQAYALQKTLGELFPKDDVRQIAYLNPRHFNVYYGIVNTDYRYFLINPRFYCNLFHRLAN